MVRHLPHKLEKSYGVFKSMGGILHVFNLGLKIPLILKE
jgi:hypothetical protein